MAGSDQKKELDAPRTVLHPPQFRLRTLLLAVSVLCGLLTVMVAVGMAWALALLMLVLLIGAHVAGNAVGTRLRDGEEMPNKDRNPVNDPLLDISEDAPHESAARHSIRLNRMQQKLPLSWLFLLLAAAGAIAGGIIGGVVVTSIYGQVLTWVAISTAVIASGIMGGIAAFITGTFIDMVRRVWREAVSEQSPFNESP